MQYYFKIEWIRLIRWFRERQVYPFIGLAIGFILLFAFTFFTYYKLSSAPWVLMNIAIYLTLISRSEDHKDFVRKTYGNATSRKIKLLEAIIIAFLFIPTLLVKGDYITAVITAILCAITSQFSINLNLRKSFPTPFSNHPFEYVTGIRKSWFLILFAYGLVAICISVNNLNLGIFSIALIAFIAMSYYSYLEHPHYVSMHTRDSQLFLKFKILESLKHYSIIISPPIVALVLKYPDQLPILLGLGFLGFLWSLSMMFIKYKSLPRESIFLDKILMAICILFPLILIFSLPYYYHKAMANLKTVLG